MKSESNKEVPARVEIQCRGHVFYTRLLGLDRYYAAAR